MITDELDRKHIYKDLNENYFVEASAGSGKTTSLVYRMVALVEGGVPVNEICTITFTKAAADEFFSRFQHYLSLRSVPLKKGEEDDIDEALGAREHMDLCQKALADIDSCFLGTTDSFLNMVAHEMPNEIDIPSDAEVIDNDVRDLFIKEEFNNMLAQDNHPLHQYALKFFDLVPYPYDAFTKGVQLVSDNRHIEMEYDHQLVDIDEAFFDDVKKDFLYLTKTIYETDFEFGTGGTDLKRKDAIIRIKRHYRFFSSGNFVDYLREVKDTANIIIKFSDSSGDMKFTAASLNSANTSFTSLLEPAKKMFVFNKDVKDLATKVLHKIDNHLHSLFFHVVIKAGENIRKSLKNASLFSFNDFLFYVRDAFKKSASTDRVLVDHIYFRHKYFLLDENQDTNPVQTELFFYLAGKNIVPDGDWTKIELNPGSIFIVGDPKQSIYGFRGADVKAYRLTEKYFHDRHETLLLTRNFRSNVSLKVWFNQVMDNLLNHGQDGLPHPDIPIDPKELNPGIKGSLGSSILLDGVYLYSTEPKDDATTVAKLIRAIIEEGKYKIITKNKTKDKEEKEKYPLLYRDIKYSDFLIVPKKTDVSKYVASFNKFDIPFVIEAAIPFDYSSSLLALVSLLFYLKDPTNKARFLNLLTSPLYNRNDLDIVSMVNSGFNLSLSSIDNEKFKLNPHYPIIEEINRLYVATLGMSYSSTLTYLVNDAKLALLNRVDNDFLEYTYFLIEKIKESEEASLLNGVESLSIFINKMINGKSNQKDNRVLRFKDKVDRVKIANLHKVKGLQAPIVILINPDEKIHEPQSFVDITSNPTKMMNRIVSEMGDNFVDKVYAETHIYSDTTIARWKESEEAEKDRVAYVAATRAESVLIISQSRKTNSNCIDPWARLSSRHRESHYEGITMNNYKLPSIEDVKEIEKTEPEIHGYDDIKINPSSNEQSITHRSPSAGKSFTINNNDDVMKVLVDVSVDKENATLKGTLVHRLLELIVSSRNAYLDLHALVVSITNQYSGGEEFIPLLEQVAYTFNHGGFKQIKSSLKDDLLSVLLDPNTEEIYCETPFSYRKDNVVINGVIDLIYKDDKGYHVVDYKTNKMKDVSTLEEDYKEQLKDYVAALKEMGVNSDAHIYHIDL